MNYAMMAANVRENDALNRASWRRKILCVANPNGISLKKI